MTTDVNDLEIVGRPTVVLLGSQAVAGADSGAATVFENLSRVYVKASARRHSSRPRGAGLLTVLVEDSADGVSWATVATFTFSASGDQDEMVESPRAFLRASWTVASGSWGLGVTAVPFASGTGGGGGGSQPITERAVWGGNNVVAIADGDIGFLPWNVQTVGTEPSPWLDTTIATEPSILEAGDYVVAVTVGANVMTAGGGFIIGLFLDSESGESTTNFQTVREVGGAAYGTVTVPYYLPVGAQLLVRVENHDGAASRDFLIVEAVLQKMS